jgi:hypothetical protein
MDKHAHQFSEIPQLPMTATELLAVPAPMIPQDNLLQAMDEGPAKSQDPAFAINEQAFLTE